MHTVETLSAATCPHNIVMGDCSDIWCTSRLEDLAVHGWGNRSGLPGVVSEISDRLLTHMARYYSDWHIANDLDCVLSACETGSDHLRVEQYARERMNAPDFNPKSFEEGERHNSHQPWMAPIHPVGSPTTHCQSCGGPMGQERSTKRFCSEVCKKRAKRQKGLVSL